MDWENLFQLSLAATLFSAAFVGFWLWFNAKERAGMTPLALFCLAMSVWCAGHLLIQTASSGAQHAGMLLISFAPFNPTLFLHFCLRFIRVKQHDRPLKQRLERHLWLGYLLAGFVSLITLMVGMGQISPWLNFNRFLILGYTGWLNVAYTFLVGVVAHGVLAWAWKNAKGNHRLQISAMFVSGVWGLACAIGFLFPSVNINIFPFPLLLLPTYIVFLVYGILRYQLMRVNRWATQAMAWVALVIMVVVVLTGILLLVAAQLGLELYSQVPFWQLWVYATLAILLALVLQTPAKKLAYRIIYPEAGIDLAVLESWNQQLKKPASWAELADVSRHIISRHVSQRVRIYFYKPLERVSNVAIFCYQDKKTENWLFKLFNWRGSSPSVRHVGAMFGALLATHSANLQQVLKITKQETKRLSEQHLVELGGLSAAVAHELRNPLNIISMASAGCEVEVKQDIQEQLQRADHLIKDLLSYSGELTVCPTPIVLYPHLVMCIKPYLGKAVDIQLQVSPDLMLIVDPHRLQQIISNLVENAVAMLSGIKPATVEISAKISQDNNMPKRNWLWLIVSDNGPGIDPQVKETIFRPFSSRRHGGSGLGLAIVRRLMEAHGGEITVIDRADWACSFALKFPVGD